MSRVRWAGRWLAGTILLLTLTGCAAVQLASREPPRLFQLTPKSTFDEALPEIDTRLILEVPTATAGLNTARIALRPTPTTLEYYAGASWVDVLPVMVQQLIAESFDNANRVDVIGRDVIGVRADYALLTHLREFQAEYQGAAREPKVRIRIQARIVRLPRRISLASTSIEQVVEADGASVERVVQAFDLAFGRVVKRLVEWTLVRLDEIERS
jgi:cholesterol transport system auxiliary component